MQSLARNQCPDLLISDKYVSCTAPATENISLQILFIYSIPIFIFGNVINNFIFCSFLMRYTIPCVCHNTTSECPKKTWICNILIFWFGNVFRATTACIFSISQFPKVVRAWCFIYILISKCVSCHNGLDFFRNLNCKKMLRTWCILNIQIWKYNSHHNNMYFFDVATAKKHCYNIIII